MCIRSGLTKVCLGLFASSVFATAAAAGVTFCNLNGDGTISMAVAAPVTDGDKRTYQVSGWYLIAPGECSRVLNGDFNGHAVYVHANLVDGNSQPFKYYHGQTPICVHPEESFNHENTTGRCRAEQTDAGFRVEGFWSFTPGYREYTMNFVP